jgi:glycosyltransferase involved in cell wall biosynthesis
MRSSDVFVFPSIRELGAGVVAEAMASGLCCVAVDYGGPAELLAHGRGITLPVAPREELTESFTNALESLAESPDRAREIGERSRQYAIGNLTWDIKALRTLDVYRWAISGKGAPPAPFAETYGAEVRRHAA